MKPYFDDGKGRVIYCGNALEVLPFIESAGLFALDPPYSMVPNAGRNVDDGAAGTSGAPIMLLNETLRHVRRCLPEGGAAGLICDWRRVPDVSYLATLAGLRISTCIAWTRSRIGLGGVFRSAWDPMLVLSVGAIKFLRNEAVKNTVHADRPHKSEHPYEKPVAVWSHLFARVPPTTVVDPFAGVGSALIAAVSTGHKTIGIEIEEKYCEIAARRLEQEVFEFHE